MTTVEKPFIHSRKALALYSLILFTPLPTVGVYFAAFGHSSTLGSLAWIVAKLGLFLGPALWWRFVQRETIVFPKIRRNGLVAGIVSALLLALVIFNAYWWIARPTLNFTPLQQMLRELGLTRPSQFLLLAMYLTLVNSLIEEYVFRWFFFQQLKQWMHPLIAVFASACIFTVHHTVVLSAYIPWYFNFLASLGVFSGGLIWSYFYYRFNQIWPAYVSHIGADIGVFLIGYHMLFS